MGGEELEKAMGGEELELNENVLHRLVLRTPVPS